MLLGVNYALLNWGIQFISSGLTAVLQAMTPVFGFVFAHLLLGDEKMTARKGRRSALGVAGVATIFWDQFDTGTSRAVQGSVAVVASAACVAISYVVMRRPRRGPRSRRHHGRADVAALGPLAGLRGGRRRQSARGPWSTTAIFSGLYLAVVGSVAAPG